MNMAFPGPNLEGRQSVSHKFMTGLELRDIVFRGRLRTAKRLGRFTQWGLPEGGENLPDAVTRRWNLTFSKYGQSGERQSRERQSSERQSGECIYLAVSFVLCGMLVFHAPAAADEPTGKAERTYQRTLLLSPGMPSLGALTCPSLVSKVADADLDNKNALAIEPPRPYRWVASPGEPFSMTVRGDGGDKAVLTVWDWENRAVAQATFATPFVAKVECEVGGRGTYVLTLDAMDGEDCTSRLVRSFSVCPPNDARRSLWKQSGFWVGQCSFPGWHDSQVRGRPVHPAGLTANESRELEAELVARMGVLLARINLPIRRRDAEGMDLDFGLADECVQAYVRKGLSLDLQLFMPYGAGLGPVLDKYAQSQSTAILPIKEQPYRHFIRETALRYGKHAQFFQIGNEPGNSHQYGGTAEEYAEQVRQAVDEIRQVRPDVPITNGGYCLTNDETQRVIAGIHGLTDFVAYHWHGDLSGLIDFWTRIGIMHSKVGYAQPKYANTEMGYPMPTVGGERANAVHEMQKILYCWAHGQVGVMLYSSRELWWPRQYVYDDVSDFGFVDHFYCPRFIYGAASAFLDRYAGYQFARILCESPNVRAYQFASGDRQMIALFAAKSPAEIRIKSDAVTARLIDPMGNESPAADPKLMTVQVGEYPVSVLLEGAAKVEVSEVPPASIPAD